MRRSASAFAALRCNMFALAAGRMPPSLTGASTNLAGTFLCRHTPRGLRLMCTAGGSSSRQQKKAPEEETTAATPSPSPPAEPTDARTPHPGRNLRQAFDLSQEMNKLWSKVPEGEEQGMTGRFDWRGYHWSWHARQLLIACIPPLFTWFVLHQVHLQMLEDQKLVGVQKEKIRAKQAQLIKDELKSELSASDMQAMAGSAERQAGGGGGGGGGGVADGTKAILEEQQEIARSIKGLEGRLAVLERIRSGGSRPRAGEEESDRSGQREKERGEEGKREEGGSEHPQKNGAGAEEGRQWASKEGEARDGEERSIATAAIQTGDKDTSA